MKVAFAVPECGNEEIEEVAAVIKSEWLITALRCAQFERVYSQTARVQKLQCESH